VKHSQTQTQHTQYDSFSHLSGRNYMVTAITKLLTGQWISFVSHNRQHESVTTTEGSSPKKTLSWPILTKKANQLLNMLKYSLVRFIIIIITQLKVI